MGPVARPYLAEDMQLQTGLMLTIILGYWVNLSL